MGKPMKKRVFTAVLALLFFINHGGLRSEWNENGRAGDIEKSRRERGDVPREKPVLFFFITTYT